MSTLKELKNSISSNDVPKELKKTADKVLEYLDKIEEASNYMIAKNMKKLEVIHKNIVLTSAIIAQEQFGYELLPSYEYISKKME